ncbi:hypothetical protein ACEZDF_17905 [Vibrio alginolyticus]|uniref:hypothetical protein n=1 Tax=Vibrio alginolyticus TaxID=663 RepID=UPI0035C1249C
MNSQAYLKALGFKFGNSGAHTSRSMMIEELKILLFGRPENATLEDYREDIEVFNVLQKPSENARKYSFQPWLQCMVYHLIFSSLKYFEIGGSCMKALNRF